MTDSIALCGFEPVQSTVAMTISRNDAAQVNTSPPYQLDSQLSELNISSKHWQFSHQYQILNYDRNNTSTPLTNGHLHSLALTYRNHNEHIHWSLAPTLSVSSSQIRHSNRLNGSAFRIEGHLTWARPLDQSYFLYMGACASSLTGDYQLLPVLGFEYKTDITGLLLAYPVSQIYFRFTKNLKLIADWSLQGQQWQVLDSDLTNRSKLHYESEMVKLGLQLNLTRHQLLETYWQKKFNQTLEYLDRNNNAVKAEVDNSDGWMIRYRYLM